MIPAKALATYLTLAKELAALATPMAPAKRLVWSADSTIMGRHGHWACDEHCIKAPTAGPSSPASGPRTVTCPKGYFELCLRFLNSSGLPMAYFDLSPVSGARCYCDTCFAATGDRRVYVRGEPAKTYVMPLRCARFGLRNDVARATALDAFKKYHVAYHGTKVSSLLGVMNTGTLAKAGDKVVGGDVVGIRPGHILKPFERDNLHTGKREMFDPVQVFLSPVLEYSMHPCYAWDTKWTDTDSGTEYKVQVAFQVRIRPGTYSMDSTPWPRAGRGLLTKRAPTPTTRWNGTPRATRLAASS